MGDLLLANEFGRPAAAFRPTSVGLGGWFGLVAADRRTSDAKARHNPIASAVYRRCLADGVVAIGVSSVKGHSVMLATLG